MLNLPRRELWVDPGRVDPTHIPGPAYGGTGVPSNAGRSAYGGAGSQPSPVVAVFQPSDYKLAQFQSFTLLANIPQLLLEEAPTVRLFLVIRNASNSTGVLGIGLNIAPTAFEQCSFELSPGGQLFLDTKVLQNQIYGVAFGGTAFAVVSYVNA